MPEETTLPERSRSEEPQLHSDPDASKIERIVTDTKTLSEDVAEWIRLKIEHLQIELHERITEELNAILSSVMVLGLLIVAFLLAMIAVAEYLGEVLGSSSYGFAVVAAFVAIFAAIVGRIQPRWIGDILYGFVPRRWLRNKKSKDDQSEKGKTGG